MRLKATITLIPVISLLALLIAPGAGRLVAQQEPSVVRIVTFLHIVSDFDQAMDFYHGKLGLEPTGHAVPPKLLDNPAVAEMYGVPGQQYRAGVVKIPGTALLLEFVQWGQARKPAHHPAAEPGAITLLWRHTDAADAGKTLHDPDGFPIQVMQSETPGADLSISVSDPQKTAALFTNVLGFKPDGDWVTSPDGGTRLRFTKAKSTSGASIPFPTPGRASVRLAVHDAAGMTGKLTAAGLTVVTTGGAPVKLPYNGPHAIILRDPSGFAVQLVETN